MTYAVLAVLMVLQIGQGCPNVMWYQTNPPMYGECEISIPDAEPIPICSVPEHGWDTTCGAMMKFCRFYSPRPRPQDLMPLVEPRGPRRLTRREVTIDPYAYIFTDARRVEEAPSVVPAIKERYCEMEVAIGGGVCYPAEWTCADKTRVLLSSEDGSGHWCVRF